MCVQYVSGEDVDVDRGNFASFKEKEEEKIRVKGVDYYYKSRTKTWRCPYCTTKPKPKDGRFDHLVFHAEDVAIRGEDYATATKVLPRQRQEFFLLLLLRRFFP